MAVIDVTVVGGGVTWSKPFGAVLVKLALLTSGGDPILEPIVFPASILGNTEDAADGGTGAEFGDWWAINGGYEITMYIITYGDRQATRSMHQYRQRRIMV